MCNLKHPGAPASTAKLPPRLRAISYACSFWVEHLVKYLSGPTDDLCLEKYLTDGGRIRTFLRRHLLHWFEALSVVSQIERGIQGLHELEQAIGNTTPKLPPESSLSHRDFVHDALRVCRQFRPALEEAPLQVYHSALIFSPENSVIRIHFKDEIPDWISPNPRTRKEWTPCLQTLEGHTGSVNSVVYSPDGRQLASCSDDNTVRLWDAATGASQGTLEGHTGSVNSVVYSPDGQQLASCSRDNTVRLWDAATGASQGTLEGHTDGVRSAVYSPDGRQLASCSWDNTVRLWDAATGACQGTLEGHTNTVAFSPDGLTMVTDSGFWSISLTSHVDHSPKRRGCGIDNQKKWATWNSANMLWLPPEYRPVASAVKEGVVAIGCSSGAVYILNFCRQESGLTSLHSKDRFKTIDTPYAHPPPSSTP